MPDVVTLTMNPALDLSSETEQLNPGQKTRCSLPRRTPGGGGINVVVLLLLAASGAALIFGEVIEAIAIGAAILVNTVIGFAMELRATLAMEALQRMGKTQARVLREGRSCGLYER